MSRHANPTLIGVFVVGAAVLLVAAVLIWGGSTFLAHKVRYVMFFDSAVTGLQKGAGVLLRGVRVGEVTDVQVRWGTRFVGVYITLEPEVLKGVPGQELRTAIAEAVKRGLRAQLRTQSLLTGVLFVALDLEPDTPIVLRALDPSTPELPTIPTDVEVWLSKFEKFAAKLDSIPLADIAKAAATTLDETTRILRSPEIKSVLRNTDMLIADTRTLVRKVETLTATVTAQVDPIAGDARQSLRAAEATLKSAQVALADVPKLVADVRAVAEKVEGHVDPLLLSLRKSSDTAQGTLEQARVTLRGVDGVLDQDSAIGYELVQAMRELRETARALRSLADYLERMPDSVVYGVRRTKEPR